jgi:hypothetical protein
MSQGSPSVAAKTPRGKRLFLNTLLWRGLWPFPLISEA